MTRYLLDTNILSDLIRNPHGAVRARIVAVGEDTICTSAVVAAELRYGARLKGSASLTERIEELIARVRVQAWPVDASTSYATIRVALERAGTPIGANDLLIAAHALAIGAVMVTANQREFERIPDLAIEDWTG